MTEISSLVSQPSSRWARHIIKKQRITVVLIREQEKAERWGLILSLDGHVVKVLPGSPADKTGFFVPDSAAENLRDGIDDMYSSLCRITRATPVFHNNITTGTFLQQMLLDIRAKQHLEQNEKSKAKTGVFHKLFSKDLDDEISCNGIPLGDGVTIVSAEAKCHIAYYFNSWMQRAVGVNRSRYYIFDRSENKDNHEQSSSCVISVLQNTRLLRVALTVEGPEEELLRMLYRYRENNRPKNKGCGAKAQEDASIERQDTFEQMCDSTGGQNHNEVRPSNTLDDFLSRQDTLAALECKDTFASFQREDTFAALEDPDSTKNVPGAEKFNTDMFELL